MSKTFRPTFMEGLIWVFTAFSILATYSHYKEGGFVFDTVFWLVISIVMIIITIIAWFTIKNIR